MQRSIASFFQPMKGKEKKEEKPTKEEKPAEKKQIIKSPLKPQNGITDSESPVKRSVKKCRAIIDSDDDEPAIEEPSQAKKEPRETLPDAEENQDPPLSSPPQVKTTVNSSVSPSERASDSDSVISPSGIPKRRTARKQFPKRKLHSTEESSVPSEEKEPDGNDAKKARYDEKREEHDNEEEENMEVDELPAEQEKGGKDDVTENKDHSEQSLEECTREGKREGKQTCESEDSKESDPEVRNAESEKEQSDAEETRTKAAEIKDDATPNVESNTADKEESRKKSKNAKTGSSPKQVEKTKRSPESKAKKDKGNGSGKRKSKGDKEDGSPKQEKKDKKSPKQEAKKVKVESSPSQVEKKHNQEDAGKSAKQSGTAEESEKTQVTKAKPISSFFAPRKAAVKLEKPTAEKSVNPLSSPEESDTKETKQSSFFGSSVKTDAAKETSSDYNPAKSHYHPVDDAIWSHGQRVPYLAVARTFEKIEEESARLRIIEILSNLFRSIIVLTPQDLLPSLYLCLNRLGPSFLGLELGVGETVLMKAVAQATGRQLDKIKAEAQEKGDLGLVAESSRSNQRMMFTPPNLTVVGVFNKLTDIAKMTGNASMNKKIDIIKGLFVACRFSEARYIVRSLGGKLRIGLAEQSVLAALAQAVCLTPPGQEFPPKIVDAGKGQSSESRKAWIEEKAHILKQTYCELPNYDAIIPVILKEGIDELPKRCKLTPGVPLKPMLAHPTRGIGEVMKRFDEAAFTCEYKYDGERAQIHILESGEVHIYSRNQENNTSKYPDIISRIPKVKKPDVVSCIVDAEAVAWDQEKKQIQPFQVLTTRKRKDVDASEIKVQVCVYAFDLLYLNGESLVRQPLSKRRQLLKESFTEKEGEFVFACSIDSDNTDVIAEFLEQSIKDSCEGLMVKTLEKDATYEIAKRSHNWLKLKKDYLEGVGDTLDLVVIGAFLGKGKRTGTYGGFLLACYDEENEEYQSICKIGTGFKDEDLEQHFNFFKEHTLPKSRPYYRVDQSTEPDVWLDAVQVWEVKCADLSLSPVHKAAMGLVDPDKGISLRFPRFLRIRDDKKPEEATSGSQVADLYRKQQQIQNQGASENAELEDYY
ncbi:DNA ligase 1 [Erpetoichthys calabaricus]|uniref:DNA ligase 1 n=1 Tax=Erpetoichthys calabaricus TaxID=27687 RepID=UPI002233FB54|nr:DNA ligase 1 [Erpetoichthys calabaricus]